MMPLVLNQYNTNTRIGVLADTEYKYRFFYHKKVQ